MQKQDDFYQSGIALIENAILESVDTVILVGGNTEYDHGLQETIYSLVSYCDSRGIHALWYNCEYSMKLDLASQVLPGRSYRLVDLDSFQCRPIEQVPALIHPQQERKVAMG